MDSVPRSDQAHELSGDHPLRVLVVDDDAQTARTLSALLRANGHEVRTALDGPSALQDAAAMSPDVVFLDLGMPGMNGYELAQQLREKAGARRPLMVAVTGYSDNEARARSEDAGIDLHLVKPVDADVLQRLLQRFRQVVRTD